MAYRLVNLGEVYYKIQIVSCASEKIMLNNWISKNILRFYEVGGDTGV